MYGKRIAPVLVATCLIGAALAPVSTFAREGARVPTFSLPAVAGGPSRTRFRMSEHVGRDPIVVLFWATWCQPCRQELPLYQRLHERFADDDGLVVVAVTMDDASTIATAGPLTRRLGLTFPVVSDLDSNVTTRLNPRRAAPFSMWIDRQGTIVREREGFSMAEREEIVRGVARLVLSR